MFNRSPVVLGVNGYIGTLKIGKLVTGHAAYNDEIQNGDLSFAFVYISDRLIR